MDLRARLESGVVELSGARLPTSRVLLHLVAHTGCHLGQIDYRRRMVAGDARGVGAVSPVALVD